jgi:hypothetical protein
VQPYLLTAADPSMCSRKEAFMEVNSASSASGTPCAADPCCALLPAVASGSGPPCCPLPEVLALEGSPACGTEASAASRTASTRAVQALCMLAVYTTSRPALSWPTPLAETACRSQVGCTLETSKLHKRQHIDRLSPLCGR